MKLYGMMEVARMLGYTRDQIDGYIRKSGCPDASMKAGRRRNFTVEDIEAIRRWLQATGKKYPESIGA